MPAKDKIPAGYTFVEGRSAETARELLEAADAAGKPGEVFTTSFGYLVPEEVLNSATESGDTEEQEEAKTEEAKTEEVKTEEVKTEEAKTEENPGGSQFDPSDAKVEEVLEYLDGADDEERARVLAAEVAGKNRTTITSAYEEGAK